MCKPTWPHDQTRHRPSSQAARVMALPPFDGTLTPWFRRRTETVGYACAYCLSLAALKVYVRICKTVSIWFFEPLPSLA